MFLHAGCTRYVQRPQSHGRDCLVLPSPYAHASDFEKIHGKFSLIYESLLSVLCQELNELHKTQHSARYWRILLGPWLISWVVAMLERIDSLALAADHCPNAETIGLAKDSWVTSADTLDFITKCTEDIFNLQLYTEVLLTGKYPINLQTLKSCRTAVPAVTPPSMGLARGLIAKLLWASYALDFPNHDVIVVDGYLINRNAAPLWWKSGLKLWPVYTQRNVFSGDRPKSPEIREKLLARLRSHTADKLDAQHEAHPILDMTARHLPSVYVENYADLCRYSETLYPRRPKAILTSNAYFYDEAFKHWAGISGDEGSKLIFAQHGGNHEHSDFEPFVEHEGMTPDAYLAWGASSRDPTGKNHYGPPLNQGNQTNSNKDNARGNGILLGVTHTGRYMHTLIPLLSPQKFEEYLLRQKRFAEVLDGRLKKLLTVRVLHDHLGWDIRQRWQDQCPEAAIDTGDSPFKKALMSSRIYVCDHLMTTYLEALRSNVPTILFWNETDYVLSAESRAAFSRLKEAGILYSCERAAANAVNTFYDHADEWWGTSEIQDAKTFFVERYAPHHPDPMGYWAKKIKALARDTSKVK